MTRLKRSLYAALAPVALFGIFAGIALDAGPANAVVYCRAVGVPRGCIARPAGRAVIHRDYGRRGTPLNRGGPVNRIGRR
jgi:hypothetical protein